MHHGSESGFCSLCGAPSSPPVVYPSISPAPGPSPLCSSLSSGRARRSPPGGFHPRPPRAPARSSRRRRRRRRLCRMTYSNLAPPRPPAPRSPGPHLIGSSPHAPPPAGQWAAVSLHKQRAPARAARPGLRLNRRCSAGAGGRRCGCGRGLGRIRRRRRRPGRLSGRSSPSRGAASAAPARS